VSLLLPKHHGVIPEVGAALARNALPGGSDDEIIVVVEDEERVRNFSVEALRELGYRVIHAADGREAFRLLEAGQPVSLLFTDVVMPEMTGGELARRARLLQPGLKVLFTSGYTPDDASMAQHLSNGERVLPKPFGIAALATAVRAALDG